MNRIKIWKSKQPRIVVRCGGLVLCSYELGLVTAGGRIAQFNGNNVSDDTERDVDEDMRPDRDVFSLRDTLQGKSGNVVFNWTVSIAPFDTRIGDIFEFTLAVLQDDDLFDVVAHYPEASGESGRLREARHEIGLCILKIQD